MTSTSQVIPPHCFCWMNVYLLRLNCRRIGAGAFSERCWHDQEVGSAHHHRFDIRRCHGRATGGIDDVNYFAGLSDTSQKIYDFIIPVERVDNGNPANLYLMDRADLQSTFTKITLWKQLQFRRIVYVDADMVALRAPDELFDLPQSFSAAPDIGWPDIFNTGLMVLSPNMGDYYALLAMAQRGISFDGADQGLLNMHFKNSFNRLSFTYNVTPSAHYQYLPAYRHFQSGISMAHFIGQSKPWTQGREANRGSTPYDEMVGRWWAVYDRHFRESVRAPIVNDYKLLNSNQSVDSTAEGSASIVQYHTKGEFQPVTPIVSTQQSESQTFRPSPEEPLHETTEIPKDVEEAYIPPVETNLEREQKEREAQYAAWDASR